MTNKIDTTKHSWHIHIIEKIIKEYVVEDCESRKKAEDRVIRAKVNDSKIFISSGIIEKGTHEKTERLVE